MRRLLIASTSACRAPSARQTVHTNASDVRVACTATASACTTLAGSRGRWPTAWYRTWS